MLRKKLTAPPQIFLKEWKPFFENIKLGRKYFDINAIKKTPSSHDFARIDFDGFIETDEVAMLFLIRRTKSVLEKAKKEEMQKLQDNFAW